VRLLLDAQLSPRRIGEPLRRLDHDVLALADDPVLRTLSDPAILELAHQEERITITTDAAHFALLARNLAASGHQHAGLVIVWSLPNNAFKHIVDGAQVLLERYPSQTEWLDLVLTL
jgi:hypothetical protein